jgi:hypothetical protein
MARHEPKMEDPVSMQMARLQAEVQTLQAQLAARPTSTKDMSLVSVIPKWSGTEKAIPLGEFFEVIEGTAKIGNWSQIDKIQVAVLKLTDAARSFYNSASELHSSEVTWNQFKAAFHKRFRDVRSDQFHFMQLQSARQKKGETPQEFADRCRGLAQKTIVQVDDPVLQKFHYEQAERMLLASFSSGLTGMPGRQVRYARPSSMTEALQIAIFVHQAEAQEQRNEAFYASVEQARNPAPDRARTETHMKSNAGRGTIRNGTQKLTCRSSTRNAQSDASVTCYECGGKGHFARECPTRKKKWSSQATSANLKDRKKQSGTPPKNGPSKGPGRLQGNE